MKGADEMGDRPMPREVDKIATAIAQGFAAWSNTEGDVYPATYEEGDYVEDPDGQFVRLTSGRFQRVPAKETRALWLERDDTDGKTYRLATTYEEALAREAYDRASKMLAESRRRDEWGRRS